MTRKDGRPLVWDHPVTAEDEIECLGKVEIPADVTCRYRSREPRHEAWMDDF